MSFPLPHTWHADNICTTVCETPIPFGNFELKGQCLGLRTCQFQNKQTNKQKLFLLHSHLLSADLNWTSGVPAKPLYLLWDRSMWRLRRSSHQKMENSAPSPALVMLSLAMWPWMGHFISLGSVSSSVKEEMSLIAKTGSNGLSSCGCSLTGHPWTILVLLPLNYVFHEFLLFFLSQIHTPWAVNYPLKLV